MSNTNTSGGPSFKVPLQPGQGWQEMAPCAGMTLRDYLAAKAMQAYFTDPNVGFGSDVIEAGSRAAYRIADAMLKARGE